MMTFVFIILIISLSLIVIGTISQRKKLTVIGKIMLVFLIISFLLFMGYSLDKEERLYQSQFSEEYK